MKKLIKRMLPILAALVLVLGSCLTVYAADTSDYAAMIKEFHAYAKNNDAPVYEYCTLFFHSGNSVNPYIYVTSSLPLGVNAYSGVYISDVGLSDSGSYSIFYYGTAVSFGGIWENRKGLIIGKGNTAGFSVVASNYDVYNCDSSFNPTTLRFAATPDFFPKPSPLVLAVGTVNLGEVPKEIILLIPLLIPCLAGFLGLRKALRFLSSILRQA